MRIPIKNLIVGLVFFCLIVFLLDILLGFTNLAKFDSEFKPGSSHPIFVEGQGELEQYYVTNPQFINSINYQIFPKQKSGEVTRIFVIGGSAAFAWPFTEEYGFSGYLRRVLDHFAPGKFEVINAAGMSFGSHRVYDVLKNVVDLSPDLILLYSGNNEYVERNVISKQKQASGAVEFFGKLLSKTNIYRAVRLAIFRIAPSTLRQETGPDLTDLQADIIVSRGALGRSLEIDQEVLSNFRSNIEEIRDVILANQIKGILFTAPSNIVNYLPTSPPLRFADENASAQWKKLQQEAVNLILSQDAVTENTTKLQSLRNSEALLLEMLKINPNDPWVNYALGHVYTQLGEHDRAYLELTRAKDLDARPIRALSSFNDAIRSIAREKLDDENLILFDLEQSLAEETKTGNADWLFLDYCHYTDAGHKLLTIKLLPFIQQVLGTNFNLDELSYWIFSDDYKKNKNQLIQNNVLFASGSTHIHNGQLEAAEEDFQKILTSLGPEATGSYASSVYRALSYVYEKSGNKELYKKNLLQAIDINPANYEALLSGGYLFLDEGNLAKASELFNKSIQLNQYSPMAFEGLGRIALMKGSAREAISHFENSIQLGGDNFSLHKNLGNAYFSLGNTDKAIIAWQEALSFDSTDKELREQVRKHSNK